MKRRISTIYAAFCTLLLAAGFLLAFFFAQRAGIVAMAYSVLGLALGFVFSPIIHELGHIAFAKKANMRVVYVKCFCLEWHSQTRRKKFSFVSPFLPDQTQAIPRSEENMLSRAAGYTLGGLVFSCAFLLIVALAAIATIKFGAIQHLFFGMLPYVAYLCLLNALPCEYASGKTDMLVYIGLKKGYPAEKTMLAAMQIQGALHAGKSFSQIGQNVFYDLPQLPEDEPLFAVMLDIQYRYFLETEALDRAADALNRLTQAQEYLPQAEIEKLAAELVYMHAIMGDLQSARQNISLCERYLKEETITAKRVLAALATAMGEKEHARALVAQGEELLNEENVAGLRTFEQVLLSRLRAALE